MADPRKYLNHSPFYRELGYIYRSVFAYKEPFSYLYQRFVVGPRIRRLSHSIESPLLDAYSIHFLSGHRDLDMLLWSLASWYVACGESGRVYIHDDGTFEAKDKEILARLTPSAVFVDFEDVSAKVLNELKDRFPRTYFYRSLSMTDRRYIFNLKLIDPFFVGEAETKLILDSDLLWFKNPSELTVALAQGQLPIFMGGYGKMDFIFSDGSELNENVAGVNSGVVGYEKNQFSLDVLEEFYSKIANNTNPHFVEQAGYAYILTRGSEPHFLPADKYHIKGSVGAQSVMKHYTNPRREQFWFEGVKTLKDKIL